MWHRVRELCLMESLFVVLKVISFATLASSQIATSVNPQPRELSLFRVDKCCHFKNNADSLIQCVNASAYENRERVIDGVRNGNGPSLSIGIMTYATDSIWNYTAYSFAVNEVYAEHNGYVMMHLDPASAQFDSYDARWNKVKILEEAIHPERGWARDLDYVMWVDADLIFLDMGLRLEKVAVEYPKAHIILCAERYGTLVNSGAMLVRNSQWSRQFLSDWWNTEERNLFSDQQQFDLLYTSRKEEMVDKIVILPPDALNSDPPAMLLQKPYNQVLHLMGEHNHYRAKVFSSAFNEICRKVEGGSESKGPLAIQLTATVPNLQLWAIDSYSRDLESIMTSYKDKMGQGLNDVKATIMLTNIVHHYTEAIEHRGLEGDKETSVYLMNQTFLYVYENLQNRRGLNARHNDEKGMPMSEWPEHLRAVVDAATPMVTLGSSSEKKTVGNIMRDLVQEALGIVKEKQHPSLWFILANLYLDLGYIDYHDHNLRDALILFDESLQIRLRLIRENGYGQHILIGLLRPMANAFALAREYDYAFRYYDMTIDLIQKHVGKEHESMIDVLINYASARHFHGSYPEEARQLLSRATDILVKSMRAPNDSAYQRAQRMLDMINNNVSVLN